jgi:DNA-binding Lrp family transcriptional regulator
MRIHSDLDSFDVAILTALRANARLSNKDLAQLAGLAPSTCLERVRRLRGLGILRGFHSDVDLGAVGVGTEAMIGVRMAEHSRELVHTFLEYVRTLPEVLQIYHVAGADDFLVHVAVRDTKHLRDLALDSFTTRAEVDRIETRLIFQHTATWALPTAQTTGEPD